MKPAGKPGGRFDDSSAFEVRNGLLSASSARICIRTQRTLVRHFSLARNALTLLPESLCNKVPCMTVRQRNNEMQNPPAFELNRGISNSMPSLYRQGFGNHCDFLSK
jgi:hypothetical protein